LLRRDVLAPDLREPKEEKLLRCEAVEHIFLALERVLQGQNAIRRLPLSAVFSPSVSRPFSFARPANHRRVLLLALAIFRVVMNRPSFETRTHADLDGVIVEHV
jgi:hypothetical protein